MTDIKPTHFRAQLARRYYQHVLNGGQLRADDVARMVEAIETLEQQVVNLKAKLDKQNDID